jgi:hypothetical protein
MAIVSLIIESGGLGWCELGMVSPAQLYEGLIARTINAHGQAFERCKILKIGISRKS